MINKIPINPRLGTAQLDKLTAKKFNELMLYQTPITLTDEPTVKWDVRKGYNATLTLKGNRTLRLDQVTKGDYGTIEIIQDAIGNRALQIPSNSKVSGAGAGTLALSSIGGSIDIATFYYNGVTFYWSLSKNFT